MFGRTNALTGLGIGTNLFSKTIQTMKTEFDGIKISMPNGNKDISGDMILPMGNDFSFGTIKYDMGFISLNLTYVE